MKLSNYIKNCEVKFDPSENIANKLEDEIAKPFAIYAAHELDKIVLDEVNYTYQAIYKFDVKIDEKQFIKDVEDLNKYRAKETPKKVAKQEWIDAVVGKVTEYHCSSCNKTVDIFSEKYPNFYKSHYCCHCGQKLDWSKECQVKNL